MHKKRLGLITLFLVWSSMVFSQEIFVSSDKYDLYRINIATCTSEFITKIKEKPTDISFHPNGKLFGISANGNFYEINSKNGAISLIYDFDGQYYNSLTISSNGIVYATGNNGILMSLDLTSGISKNHGNIGFEATGDLTFIHGELYAAVTLDRIVKVDINQPENSTVKIQGQTNAKIFGIVSYAEGCNEIQTFTLTDGNTRIHQIDLENGTLKFVCELNFATYGGASTYEFLSSSPLVIKNLETVHPSCSDNGQIIVLGKGGIGQLEYSLDGIKYQTNNTFDSLKSGDYTIKLKDTNGCIMEGKITLISQKGPEIKIVNSKNESCQGGDGEIVASGKNGTGNLTFKINETDYSINSTFKGLKKGGYTVTVKDENDCFSSSFVDLKYNEPPKITNVAISPTTCGENNGTIAVEVKAKSSVLYSLNDKIFRTEASFNNLSRGQYLIFAKNQEACLDSVTVEIAGSKVLKIASIKSIQPSCIDSLGILEIIESSGEDDLLYSIDGVSYQKNNRFQNLRANTYRPIILNDQGCIDEAEVKIQRAPKLIMENINSYPANCGKANGKIQFDIKNFTGSLITTIDDDRNVKGTSIDSLWTGQYRISVTDANGCKVDSVLSISQGDCPVHIPNSFSPNEDGGNDYYKIFADSNFNGKLLSFSVYNRWGTRIFYKENFKSGDNLWDGSYRGEVQNVGVFAYLLKVEFESGITDTIHGALTLIR